MAKKSSTTVSKKSAAVVAKLQEQFDAPSAPQVAEVVTVTIAPETPIQEEAPKPFHPEVIVSAIQLQKKQEELKLQKLSEQLQARGEQIKASKAVYEELRKQLRTRSEEILGELRLRVEDLSAEVAKLEEQRDRMFRGKGQMEERIRQARGLKAKRDAALAELEKIPARIAEIEANLSKG